MAYTRTIAFNTRSTARHGGDFGWIRHANGRLVSDVRSGDLRGVEAIGTIANTLAQLTATFAQLRQAKMDSKAAKNDAAGQERQAAAIAAENATLAAAQATAQAAALEKVATQGNADGSKSNKLLIGGAALVGLGVLFFAMKRK